jgi:hypothetical protein
LSDRYNIGGVEPLGIEQGGLYSLRSVLLHRLEFGLDYKKKERKSLVQGDQHQGSKRVDQLEEHSREGTKPLTSAEIARPES